MNQVSEILSNALQAVYPGVVFDTEGLVLLLLPSLAIVLIGLLIFLFMKIPRAFRRFAYVPVILALIVTIAASSFFPVSLMQAGNSIMEQLQQIVPVHEEASF